MPCDVQDGYREVIAMAACRFQVAGVKVALPVGGKGMTGRLKPAGSGTVGLTKLLRGQVDGTAASEHVQVVDLCGE